MHSLVLPSTYRLSTRGTRTGLGTQPSAAEARDNAEQHRVRRRALHPCEIDVVLRAILEQHTCSRIKAANDSGPSPRTRDASPPLPIASAAAVAPAPSPAAPAPSFPVGDDVDRARGDRSCSSRFLARASEPPPRKSFLRPLSFFVRGGCFCGQNRGYTEGVGGRQLSSRCFIGNSTRRGAGKAPKSPDLMKLLRAPCLY